MLAIALIAGYLTACALIILAGYLWHATRPHTRLSHHDSENGSDRDGASGQIHNGDIA